MRFIIVLSIVSTALICQGEVKVKSLKPRYTSQMTVAGYAGESTLENFPVPVRISEDAIAGFDYAKCDGQGDITFTDANGIVLPHEIEVWNTEGESVAWVSVPALTQGATFNMNWAHQKKLETVQSQEVWTAATFKGVWHMAEEANIVPDSSGASRVMKVSSSYTHGVNTNAAKIGVAFYGKASDESDAPVVVMQTGAFYMGYTSDCTLTGWIKMTGFDGTNAKPFGPYKKCDNYYWQLYGASSMTKTALRFKSTLSTTAIADFNPKSAGWFHYAIVIHKRAAFDLYINGEYIGSHTPGNEGYYKFSGALYLYLNGTPGYLDETRVRDSLSSADWVKAEYDSVNNTQFITASAATRNSYGISIIVR